MFQFHKFGKAVILVKNNLNMVVKGYPNFKRENCFNVGTTLQQWSRGQVSLKKD